MKYVFLVLVIGVIGGGFFWYLTENEKAERAEAYRREQIRLEKEETERARQREEAERVWKERAAALAKDDAVKLFLRYLDREEERLKKDIEEKKILMQKVDLDQRALSDELLAIEKANAARLASAAKRGEKQRDKVERVTAILKSPVINRLALDYCGEDLAALRSEYLAEIQKTKDVDDLYHKKRAANSKAYADEIKDVDKEVSANLGKAKEKLSKATAGTKANVAVLEKRLADLDKGLKKLEEKDQKASVRAGPKLTPWERQDLERKQALRATTEAQLAAARNQLEYGDVDAAHREAIVAESRARSRADTAMKRLHEADFVVKEEHDHELRIYDRSVKYEARSLDRVRAAMASHAMQLESAAVSDRKKLDFLHESSVNIDFLNAEEVEAMRRKVAKRLAENIAGGDAE